jgi:hypothetical protein
MEEAQHVQEREQGLAKCWEAVEKEINVSLASVHHGQTFEQFATLQEVTSSQHDKVFGDLLKFISLSHKKLHTLQIMHVESSGTPLARRKLPPRLEVSTAVLITGVNMPDHAVLYERLERQIHQHCTPYVVLLRARDCNSGREGQGGSYPIR